MMVQDDIPRISVLLTTEGTYPFYKGGVSTWCHNLTHKLREIDFRIFAVTSNPFAELCYELPTNVTEIVRAPLWGTMEPADYAWHQSLAEVLRSKMETKDENLGHDYIHHWECFLKRALQTDDHGNPRHSDDLASALLNMHVLLLTRYNYHRVWSSPLVWEAFAYYAYQFSLRCSAGPYAPSIAELKQSYRLLYHFFSVLSFPIPSADVNHSSAAGFCGLPCIIARIAFQRPFLLTEHGVYLREQYLNLRRSVKSVFVRALMYKMFTVIARLNYAYADQISPVCAFNARWERELGTDTKKIRIIYNGCDPDNFYPRLPEPKTRPLVSTVGLIYELKGQRDLIEASQLVKRVVPDVEFRIYGGSSDETYYARCIEDVKRYGLEDTVYFKGISRNTSQVYSNADVVAFSSISEGFPYVVVEAMLSSAAIVSTDVGGIREALDNCGILVRPRSPCELAQAIIVLLKSPDQRHRLGERARKRALSKFTEEIFLENHRSTYLTLADAYGYERSAK